MSAVPDRAHRSSQGEGASMPTSTRTHARTATVEQIRQCAAAGMSVCHAAAHLRVSRSGLASAVGVLGIAFRGQWRTGTDREPRATTTEARIRQCADLGMSRRQAADQLGVGRDALANAAYVLGIRFHGHSGCVLNRIELQHHAAHDPFGRLTP